MRSSYTVRSFGPPGWRLIPPVTRAVLVATGLAYLATLLSGMPILVLVPAQVLSGQVWRLVTYPLVNVGILSVLFDLLLLWSFGSQMEPRWGSRRFTLFLFLATLSAGSLGVLADRLFPEWAFGAGFGWAAPLTALIVAWTLQGPSLPTNFFGILPMTRLGFAAIALALVVFGELERTRSLSRLLFVLGGLPVSWLFRGSGPGGGMRLPRVRSPFSRRRFRVVSGSDERIH